MLKGKVAIVTGSTSGIGLGIATALAQQGADVMLNGFGDRAAIDRTVQQLAERHGVRTAYSPADMSKSAAVAALVAETGTTLGPVDIMVNNAGIAMVQDFLDVTKADYDKVLGVNLEGAFWGTQAAARQMIAQGEGGVIINMSSINSGLANPRVATYAITKGGMNQITGTAAVAFARNGIRVVGVGPGTIDTEMVRGEFVSDATEHAILSRTPLGRYGTAAEIAAVVAFLASDDASYVTGETIYPDGGRRVLNYVMPNKQ